MPRRNRQKLHRQLRLRAEARKAELRARRLARRASEARLRAAISALRGGASGPPAQAKVEHVLGQVASLLRLASVSVTVQRKVARLVDVLGAQARGLLGVEQLPWLVLLADAPWTRSPESWRRPSGSARRVRDAFASHLLVRYTAPPFLLRALDVEPLAVARVPVEDQWAVGLLAHMGQGGSLRQVVGSSLMPAPLTRQMCHRFLRATANTEPVAALRAAQVAGFGGPKSLGRALVRTRLGRLRGDDATLGEASWQRVIGWVCARPALAEARAADLDRVLAWIEAMKAEAAASGATWSLKGRTVDSVRHAADAWQSLQRERVARDGFPSSGLLPLDDGPWSFVEIHNVVLLRAEGRAMRHCATAYRSLLKRGKASLWSLRRAGQRCATVEVSLGAAAVVQAKGKANRACTEEERAAIAAWATHNRLELRL